MGPSLSFRMELHSTCLFATFSNISFISDNGYFGFQSYGFVLFWGFAQNHAGERDAFY